MAQEATKKEQQKPQKRKIIVPIAIIVAILAGCYLFSESRFQSTDDAYVEADIIQVTPKVSGHIVESYIQDNKEVKKGDIVAKIDDEVYKEKYEQARANYEKALLNQKNAKATLKAADSEIALAKLDLERYQKLFAEGAISKQMLDKAQANYDAVNARLTHAQENIFSKGDNVADADLKALKAIMNQAKLNLEYTNVTAPNTGIVTNRRIEKGSYVSVGAPLFAIVPDKIWVVANFKENQVGAMKAGQEVKIKVDAYKGKTFKGHIDSIQRASGAKSSLFPPENAVGSFVKIVQRIPVKIVFDEEIKKEEYNIVSGMSVVPKVKVK
ncbi:MAG: HlyD family secretion protein [Candidatus Gastranaerophilales bacterium]|nr:HlyD family secretion protein [Candidatus Gastranaerophilales bacterium]